MSSRPRHSFGGLALLLSLTVAGCGDPSGDAPLGGEPGTREAKPDSRLEVHAIEPGTPSKAGLEYIETVAEAHAEADAKIAAGDSGAARAELRRQLSQPRPDGVAEAEALQLDLAARLAQLELEAGDAEAARQSLEPRLMPTSRSLPLDPVTARALVTLGDAARAGGDDALAAGSYARALKIMSMESAELGEDVR